MQKVFSAILPEYESNGIAVKKMRRAKTVESNLPPPDKLICYNEAMLQILSDQIEPAVPGDQILNFVQIFICHSLQFLSRLFS